MSEDVKAPEAEAGLAASIESETPPQSPSEEGRPLPPPSEEGRPLQPSSEEGMQESEEGGHLQSSSEEGGGLEALLRVSREEGGMDESSKALCREMFEKVTEYLNGELAVTSEEYQLLHRLNQMTTVKYSDMSALASRLNEVSQRLNDKYVSLQPYCDLIDQVEASVSSLEQTAYRLDAYCKRLETRFRELERR